MITAELRVRLAWVVLIAVLELITPPRIPRVLRHRRHPDRVDAQTVKESLFYLLRDTREVTTLVVHDIQHLRRTHLPVVIRIAVCKSVHHQRVQHLTFRIVTGQLLGINHRLAVL